MTKIIINPQLKVEVAGIDDAKDLGLGATNWNKLIDMFGDDTAK